MPQAVETVKRKLAPRLIVQLSRMDARARMGARVRRRLGRQARVELFFAFDDPNSAVAVIDLVERLKGYDVLLLPKPVSNRGISKDPAVEQKRCFALEDARRLFARSDLTLKRQTMIDPKTTAFLARWVASAPPGQALSGFCAAACRRIWLEEAGEIDEADYSNLWMNYFDAAPIAAGDTPVRSNERLMKSRGPYDTPAAWVHGQWFFAHDRLEQIAERLDDLGWGKQA